VFFQRLLAAEGGGPGAGADAHPVQRDAVEVDQVLLAQDGDGAGQQAVEEPQVAGAEVGQGVVVDGHAAGDPAEGVVLGAQPGQGAGGAYALQGGVQPQGDGQARVEGRVPGAALAGADGVVQAGQVEALTVGPDEAGLVVVIEQILQRHRRDDPLPIRRPQPRRWALAHDPALVTAL
jgi:hypothetical protein